MKRGLSQAEVEAEIERLKQRVYELQCRELDHIKIVQNFKAREKALLNYIHRLNYDPENPLA